MIEEGTCEAYKTENGNKKLVYSYKPGGYFGELALLRDCPRQASIVCTSDCTLVALDRYTFKRLLGPMDALLKEHASKY